ncbi:HAMP domain-containing sensor histidine kinase [Actinocorallia aurea]
MGAEGGEGRLKRRLALVFVSLRGRITLLSLAVSAIILAACLFLVLALFRQETQSQAAQEAARTAVRVASEVVKAPLSQEQFTDGADYVQVVADDGTVLAASEPLKGRPAITRARSDDPADPRADVTDCSNGLGSCVYIVGLRVRNNAYGQPVTVYAAARVAGVVGDEASPVGFRTTVILIGVLVLIGVLTWLSAYSSLRPVRQITRELSDITASDLSRRVPVQYSGGSELQELAETINDTLARLEEATDRQRRFVAEVSHDLRNPIAGLLTRLEVLDAEDEDFPWKEDVHHAVGDVERLSSIVEDLLELARLESGTPPPTERLDLGELVAAELARRPPGRLPVAADLTADVRVDAGRLRVARLLGNLLANAQRHGRTRVDVTVAVEDGLAVLRVDDDGAGLAPEDTERIFERFARLKESRELDSGGTGLGLPIAQEIARNYGGTLTASPGPGGHFTLRLPLSPG